MNPEDNNTLNSYQLLSREELQQYRGGGKINDIYKYLHMVFGGHRH